MYLNFIGNLFFLNDSDDQKMLIIGQISAYSIYIYLNICVIPFFLYF